LYTFEMKTVGSLSGMALKDSTGKYLTAVGSNATLQGRQRTVGKDELFVAEDSQPQVFLTAHNNKIVSIRQGLYSNFTPELKSSHFHALYHTIS
jgi:fascin 1